MTASVHRQRSFEHAPDGAAKHEEFMRTINPDASLTSLRAGGSRYVQERRSRETGTDCVNRKAHGVAAPRDQLGVRQGARHRT